MSHEQIDVEEHEVFISSKTNFINRFLDLTRFVKCIIVCIVVLLILTCLLVIIIRLKNMFDGKSPFSWLEKYLYSIGKKKIDKLMTKINDLKVIETYFNISLEKSKVDLPNVPYYWK